MIAWPPFHISGTQTVSVVGYSALVCRCHFYCTISRDDTQFYVHNDVTGCQLAVRLYDVRPGTGQLHGWHRIANRSLNAVTRRSYRLALVSSMMTCRVSARLTETSMRAVSPSCHGRHCWQCTDLCTHSERVASKCFNANWLLYKYKQTKFYLAEVLKKQSILQYN